MIRQLVLSSIMILRRILLAAPLLLLFVSLVEAWHRCSFWSNDVCPTGNACCLDRYTNSYRCLSGKNETTGECCSGQTGCKDGFRCAGDDDDDDKNNKSGKDAAGYCARIDPKNDLLPERVPHYQLCALPSPRALKEVYGLAMKSANGDDNNDDIPAEAANRGLRAAANKDGPVEQPVAAYLSNLGSLDTDDPALRRAQAAVETVFIVVHGSSRNADDYLCCAHQAVVGAANWNVSSAATMVVAPWFLAPHDAVTSHTGTTAPLRWAERGPIPHTWRYGADAMHSNISSYAVMDALLDRFVLDHRNRFPSLRKVVVAGHSAGGQYVQRWALLSNHDIFDNNNNNNNVDEQQSTPPVSIRVVVANPKSLVWLDDRRVMEDGVLRRPEADAIYLCPSYDEWEWGLDNSTRTTERDALDAPYKDRAIRRAGGIEAMQARYATRDIVYLAGEQDVLWNGECEDKMQGRFRRERSEHFFAALQEYYGHAVHHRLVVAGVHHDHCLMFQSPEGRKALFGSF